MASYNRVILAGNLTRDPELRTLPKGTAICQFGLAINRKFKDDAGQQRDETTFVDCEAWGKTAELVSKYLTKGRQTLVEGRLKLDSWEDKQTQQKRSKLKVVVESVQFLSAANSSENNSAPVGAGSTTNNNTSDTSEDVPF